MSEQHQPPKIEDKKPTINMEKFRREIASLIAREKGEDAGMMELDDVNPDELTEADADMWYRVNNYTPGLITRSEFATYNQYSENKSRDYFRQVVVNKLNAIWGHEELAKMHSGEQAA